jgi:hypothetical protein
MYVAYRISFPHDLFPEDDRMTDIQTILQEAKPGHVVDSIMFGISGW